MLSFFDTSVKKQNIFCLICHGKLSDTISSPDTCKDIFHYKCLRSYIDDQLHNKNAVVCPESKCKRHFSRIANKHKQSDDIVYQNVILSNDESTCCICFSKFKSPVASLDSCSHTFCFECIRKWCTFKHECPMDRLPINMLLVCDFPGAHIVKKLVPPPIEQDLDIDNDEITDTICEICNSGRNEDQLLLCDRCNHGYHIYCISVPLSSIPIGEWYCDACRVTIRQESFFDPARRLPRGLGQIITTLQNRFDRNIPSSNGRQSRRNAQNTTLTLRGVLGSRSNEPIVKYDYSSSEESISSRGSIIISNIHLGGVGGIRTRSGRHLTSEIQVSSSSSSSSSRSSSSAINEGPNSFGMRTRNRSGQGNTRKYNIHKDEDSLSSSVESDMELITRKNITESPSTSGALSPQHISLRNRSKIRGDSDDDDDWASVTYKRRLINQNVTNNKRQKKERISALSTKNSQPYDTDLEPSTSKKRKVPKKMLSKTRKYKKRRSSKRLSTTRRKFKNRKPNLKGSLKPTRKGVKQVLESKIIPRKLSILGRENQLPCISDDERSNNNRTIARNQIANVRTTHGNGSILSAISDGQNNLRNMTLSTIKRLSDGTIMHRPHKVRRTDIVQAVGEVQKKENVALLSSEKVQNISLMEDIGIPPQSSSQVNISNPVIEGSTKKERNISSTIKFVLNNDNAEGTCLKTGSSSLGITKKSSKVKEEVQTAIKIVQNNDTIEGAYRKAGFLLQRYKNESNKAKEEVQMLSRSAVHFSSETVIIPPDYKDAPSTSQTCSSTTTLCSYNPIISSCVAKALNRFYHDRKIDKDEHKTLRKRIFEKISSKVADYKPQGKKVKEYVEKYVKFYLSKKEK